MTGNGDKIILRIDGEPVTEGDIQKRIRTNFSDMEFDMAEPERRQAIIADAVEEEIFDRLLLKAAISAGVQVTPSEVDSAVLRSKEMFGEEGLQKMMDQRDASEQDYREYLEEVLIIGRYEEKLYENIDVDDAAVTEYYEGNKEIFILPETVRLEVILAADGEVAGQMYKRLQDGEVFEEVLAEYSALNDKTKGTKMPWLPYEKIPPALRDAVESAEAGELLAPVQTSEGSTIIKVLERRPPGIPPLDEVRKNVGELLLKQKKHEVLQSWYDAERGKVNIESMN